MNGIKCRGRGRVGRERAAFKQQRGNEHACKGQSVSGQRQGNRSGQWKQSHTHPRDGQSGQ